MAGTGLQELDFNYIIQPLEKWSLQLTNNVGKALEACKVDQTLYMTYAERTSANAIADLLSLN